MATNNIKIFDENKSNIMPSEEYGTNSQRLNGVQQGIASSMLQNKTLYQLSLVAYAIGQMMVNNGLDANDDNAVSAFVGNLANTIVQKVVDKASTAEAQAGTDANKFMTPATTRAAINVLKATSGMATAGTDDTHWMTPALVKQMINSNVSSLTGYSKVFDQTFNFIDSSASPSLNLSGIFSNYNKFIFLMDTTLNVDRSSLYIQYDLSTTADFVVKNEIPLIYDEFDFKANTRATRQDVCYMNIVDDSVIVFIYGSELTDGSKIKGIQRYTKDHLLDVKYFLASDSFSSETFNVRLRILAGNTKIGL